MIDRKKKYYTYACILYRDSLEYDYQKVIDFIVQNWTNYAYIEHEPEKDETKKHTHILVHFDNKRYISALSKELGVKENYFQPCNLIPYLRYLIHLDDEDKIQYSPYEVQGPLQKRLIEIVQNNKMSEVEQVSCICEFIFEFDTYLHYATLLQFVLKNGCYSAYRRNYHFFKDLVLEKNQNL